MYWYPTKCKRSQMIESGREIILSGRAGDAAYET